MLLGRISDFRHSQSGSGEDHQWELGRVFIVASVH